MLKSGHAKILEHPVYCQHQPQILAKRTMQSDALTDIKNQILIYQRSTTTALNEAIKNIAPYDTKNQNSISYHTIKQRIAIANYNTYVSPQHIPVLYDAR